MTKATSFMSARDHLRDALFDFESGAFDSWHQLSRLVSDTSRCAFDKVSPFHLKFFFGIPETDRGSTLIALAGVTQALQAKIKKGWILEDHQRDRYQDLFRQLLKQSGPRLKALDLPQTADDKVNELIRRLNRGVNLASLLEKAEHRHEPSEGGPLQIAAFHRVAKELLVGFGLTHDQAAKLLEQPAALGSELSDRNREVLRVDHRGDAVAVRSVQQLLRRRLSALET